MSGRFFFVFFFFSFFAAHRTAARDTSVNVVERDLSHILVMRYGARLVLLSPDGRVQNGDCSTSWYEVLESEITGSRA